MEPTLPLFDEEPSRSLADRLRPTRLNVVAGRDHLLALDAPLGRVVAAQRLRSAILWGPSASGRPLSPDSSPAPATCPSNQQRDHRGGQVLHPGRAVPEVPNASRNPVQAVTSNKRSGRSIFGSIVSTEQLPVLGIEFVDRRTHRRRCPPESCVPLSMSRCLSMMYFAT